MRASITFALFLPLVMLGVAVAEESKEPPRLSISDVSVDRDVGFGHLEVKARVTNLSQNAVPGVSVSFLLWDPQGDSAFCSI